MDHWLYTVTTIWDGTDGTDLVVAHMQEMDGRGWELLNGSTIYGHDRIAYTMWWRRAAPVSTPAQSFQQEATPPPGTVRIRPRPKV